MALVVDLLLVSGFVDRVILFVSDKVAAHPGRLIDVAVSASDSSALDSLSLVEL